MPVVAAACTAVGIYRGRAYEARAADKEFAKAWDDAMEDGVDAAEAEAFRRAVQGFEEPVVYQGVMALRYQHDAQGRLVLDENNRPVPLTGPDGQPVPLTIRKHSDALLALVLKGRRKKVYADRTELTGADGGPMLTDETTRMARLSQLLAAAKLRKDLEADPNADLL